MASKELSRVDGQEELPLSRRAEPNTVPAEMIRRQKTAAAALTLACTSSGLEDKEIYGEVGIDAGYFTRIKKGEATLQADLLQTFCDTVGNRVYLEWLAYQVGCTLVEIKSEAERRADALAIDLAEQRKENRLLRELVQGRVAA